MQRNIDEFLSASVLRDLRRAATQIPPGRVLRLVRLPVDEFNAAIRKAIQRHGSFLPFQPVVLHGIPVDMTTGLVPEAVLVADDDTNLARLPSQQELELEI